MNLRSLLAYYSRKGHVSQVAEIMAKGLEAETERIIDRKFRGWPWSYIFANREAMKAIPANIKEPEHDPAGYDLVIVGSPVWNDRMSTPALAYLKRFSGRFPEVAFFLTCAVDCKTVPEEMAAFAGRKPLATLIVLDRELKNGTAKAKVAGFIEMLKASRP